MNRAEALRLVAELHTAWSLRYGDEVPYVAADRNPHDGETSDLSVWQADRSAPSEIDDPLNAQIKTILAQVDEAATGPDNHEPAVSAAAGVAITNIAPEDIDLRQVQADWEAHLDQLLAAWVGITSDQRAEIVDQVRAAVSRDDVAALAALHVSTAAATAALMAAMNEMAIAAAERMVEEAAEQDVTLAPAVPDGSVLASLAAALAILLAEGLTNAAAREALRRYNPQVDADAVVDAVREHLEGLSDAFLRDNLGGALTAAQNAGRMKTMLAGPSAAIYGSEQMDKRTCKPCRKINGKWIGNSDDPDIEAKIAAVYPNGGYRDCEGGIRCRGTTVAVYRAGAGSRVAIQLRLSATIAP